MRLACAVLTLALVAARGARVDACAPPAGALVREVWLTNVDGEHVDACRLVSVPLGAQQQVVGAEWLLDDGGGGDAAAAARDTDRLSSFVSLASLRGLYESKDLAGFGVWSRVRKPHGFVSLARRLGVTPEVNVAAPNAPSGDTRDTDDTRKRLAYVGDVGGGVAGGAVRALRATAPSGELTAHEPHPAAGQCRTLGGQPLLTWSRGQRHVCQMLPPGGGFTLGAHGYGGFVLQVHTAAAWHQNISVGIRLFIVQGAQLRPSSLAVLTMRAGHGANGDLTESFANVNMIEARCDVPNNEVDNLELKQFGRAMPHKTALSRVKRDESSDEADASAHAVDAGDGVAADDAVAWPLNSTIDAVFMSTSANGARAWAEVWRQNARGVRSQVKFVEFHASAPGDAPSTAATSVGAFNRWLKLAEPIQLASGDVFSLTCVFDAVGAPAEVAPAGGVSSAERACLLRLLVAYPRVAATMRPPTLTCHTPNAREGAFFAHTPQADGAGRDTVRADAALDAGLGDEGEAEEAAATSTVPPAAMDDSGGSDAGENGERTVEESPVALGEPTGERRAPKSKKQPLVSVVVAELDARLSLDDVASQVLDDQELIVTSWTTTSECQSDAAILRLKATYGKARVHLLCVPPPHVRGRSKRDAAATVSVRGRVPSAGDEGSSTTQSSTYKKAHNPQKAAKAIESLHSRHPYRLGVRLSRALDFALGEYIALWSTESVYGPSRITDQLAQLVRDGASLNAPQARYVVDASSFPKYQMLQLPTKKAPSLPALESLMLSKQAHEEFQFTFLPTLRAESPFANEGDDSLYFMLENAIGAGASFSVAYDVDFVIVKRSSWKAIGRAFSNPTLIKQFALVDLDSLDWFKAFVLRYPLFLSPHVPPHNAS